MITLASAILQLALADVSIETQVTVALLFLLTLNMSGYSRKLIVGFSFVNTRLPFDTEVLIDENKEEKVIFDFTIDGKKQTKRISSKILKRMKITNMICP